MVFSKALKHQSDIPNRKLKLLQRRRFFTDLHQHGEISEGRKVYVFHSEDVVRLRDRPSLLRQRRVCFKKKGTQRSLLTAETGKIPHQ